MITRAALTGDPAFELIGPDKTVLAPGDAAKLDLTFAPTACGAADSMSLRTKYRRTGLIDGDIAPVVNGSC
jgi:hypothetical protein